jgi:hypothetical protein
MSASRSLSHEKARVTFATLGRLFDSPQSDKAGRVCQFWFVYYKRLPKSPPDRFAKEIRSTAQMITCA